MLMNRSWIVILAALVLLGAGAAAFVIQSKTDGNSAPIGAAEREYVNDVYGISFRYPDTYQLEEAERGGWHRGLYVITLMRKADLPPPEGGEGPPAIEIAIYQNNLDQMSLHGWLVGTNFSNYKLSFDGLVSSTTVDGAEAIAYNWSGLYTATTTAFLHKDSLIAASVMFLERGDEIVRTYYALLDSLQLK